MVNWNCNGIVMLNNSVVAYREDEEQIPFGQAVLPSPDLIENSKTGGMELGNQHSDQMALALPVFPACTCGSHSVPLLVLLNPKEGVANIPNRPPPPPAL